MATDGDEVIFTVPFPDLETEGCTILVRGEYEVDENLSRDEMDSQLSSIPAKVFHRFSNLAVELQMMIWERVPSKPRSFQVDSAGIRVPLTRDRQTHPILRTCRLSRKIGLERFIQYRIVNEANRLMQALDPGSPFTANEWMATNGWMAANDWMATNEWMTTNDLAIPTVRGPVLYIDPAWDLFDFISPVYTMWTDSTMEHKPTTTEALKNSLSQALGLQINLKRIRNIAVKAPESGKEFAETLRGKTKSIREAVEAVFPNADNVTIVSQVDVTKRHSRYDGIPAVFRDWLLAAAEINRFMGTEQRWWPGNHPTCRRYFEPSRPRYNHGTSHRGVQPTSSHYVADVLTLGEGICYMESVQKIE